MNEELATIHATAARLFGKDSACRTKVRHASYQKALSHATRLNLSPKKRHDNEPYFCSFCLHWHIGRILDREYLMLYFLVMSMIDSGAPKKTSIHLDVSAFIGLLV